MPKRLTSYSITASKGQQKIVVLTAYTALMARVLDAHVDILLVGDSLGMVLYGMDSTLPVSLEMMIGHGRAVQKASEKALVVVDLPFGTYQISPGQAFASAARVMQETGCGAVKLEGGEVMAETVRFLTGRGIPVMGHVGVQPQSLHLTGYGKQGKDSQDQARIMADATAVEEAGAFALVVENIDSALAAEITKQLSIPVIGIGASKECDGQVLVTDDLLGLTAAAPPFVTPILNLNGMIDAAIRDYAKSIRNA